MPASKKDLRAKKQKDNVKAGIGDANGRLPSQNKVGTFNMTQWKPGCTVPKKGSLFSVFKLNSVYWCVFAELIYAQLLQVLVLCFTFLFHKKLGPYSLLGPYF